MIVLSRDDVEKKESVSILKVCKIIPGLSSFVENHTLLRYLIEYCFGFVVFLIHWCAKDAVSFQIRYIIQKKTKQPLGPKILDNLCRSGKNNAEGDLEWMSEEEIGNASHASNKRL